MDLRMHHEELNVATGVCSFADATITNLIYAERLYNISKSAADFAGDTFCLVKLKLHHLQGESGRKEE